MRGLNQKYIYYDVKLTDHGHWTVPQPRSTWGVGATDVNVT